MFSYILRACLSFPSAMRTRTSCSLRVMIAVGKAVWAVRKGVVECPRAATAAYEVCGRVSSFSSTFSSLLRTFWSKVFVVGGGFRERDASAIKLLTRFSSCRRSATMPVGAVPKASRAARSVKFVISCRRTVCRRGGGVWEVIVSCGPRGSTATRANGGVIARRLCRNRN